MNETSRQVPAFAGNIGFNAQHSPNGAFFSFTCGNFGTRGGFGLQIGKPGNQNLFIGIKEGDRKSASPLKCLPFFEGAAASDGAANFLVEQAGPEADRKPTDAVYSQQDIHRHYSWGTDRWVTPDFEFTIYTPIVDIPDPDASPAAAVKDAVLPAVVAELVIDNTQGAAAKTAFFAVTFSDPGAYLDQATLTVTHRDGFGMRAFDSDSTAFAFMRWGAKQGLSDTNPIHMLGNTPGFGITVEAGQKRSLRFAIGAYLPGVVTRGIEGRYFYTNYYNSLENVLATALERFEELRSRAAACDQQLLSSSLSADQQFLIAHSTRSYYGSTELLAVADKPFWIVNEGEYCMLNTLDLSVDHVFWELQRNAWVVRNLLDNFVRFYSYRDQVRSRGKDELMPGGLSFCHDMGVHNVFSPQGNSSYELPNLNAACFSYMTGEQLCNWVIMATSYLEKTGDTGWAKQSQKVFDACLQSLINRGDDNGFPAMDSSRCGPGGAEITTYDSLDHSLAQTRNNLYMIVKVWASYIGLRRIFDKLADAGRAGQATAMAEKIAAALPAHAGEDGSFPAVFEKDNLGYASRILPAVEALVYPLEWDRISGSASSVSEKTRAMINVLKSHTVALLGDPKARSYFADGGIRLSSTSNNSWVSKIAILQHVVRKVFSLHKDAKLDEKLARADAAHVKWETEGDSAYWAMSDQMVNGVAAGSKYYPRCITTALWLDA